MVFPFVIELKREIKVNDDFALRSKVFDIIQNYLRSKSVNDFYKTENKILFKKGFFGLNTNVFAVIDKGEFELIENDGKYKLKYRFYLFWFFLISIAISIGVWLFSGEFVFAITTSFFLIIANFIFCLVGQQGVINELASIINKANKNKEN